METFEYKRTLPVCEQYDVFVAGGGPAGSSAALAAARMGAKVLLIEHMGGLGGMNTNGLVSILDTTTDGRRMIVGGIMKELIEELYDQNYIDSSYGWERFTREKNVYTPFDPEGMKLILDRKMREAGVDVRFFTRLVDVDGENGCIRGAIISNVEGLSYVKAKTYIDGTGDAAMANAAGAACCAPMSVEYPGIMGATLCAQVSNVSRNREDYEKKDRQLEMAWRNGFFRERDRHVPGIFLQNNTVGVMNAGHLYNVNPLDAACLSNAMMDGRILSREYVEFYRQYVPGFENAYLTGTASLMGIRESRRIVGEYVITYEDFMARRTFPDQIGLYSKRIDVHPYNASDEESRRHSRQLSDEDAYRDGESYGIPYRILVPKGSQNLWVAGRCASTDRMMQGSLRVQPAACIMGQAAGTAAALTCNNMFSMDNLQNALIQQKAVLE